jgi:(p)ppGpp synthase/HD superfamily hydrolase
VDRLEVGGRDLPEALHSAPPRETPTTQPPPFAAHSSWKSWAQARAALAGRLPEETLQVLDGTWAYALACHGQQRRPNNEPYPIHLLEVVEILVASGVRDCDILQAGMLHDVVEDTPHPLSELCQRFGRGVSELVDWMTKPEAGPGQDPAAVRLAYLRQFEHAPPGAAVVKLADRLSNVQRLHTHPRPAKQRSYYQETVEQVMPHAEGHPWFEGQFRLWQEAFAYLAPEAPPPSA